MTTHRSSMAPVAVRACPVRTADEVETLRRLRNAAASFMTGHQQEISPAQQAAWWASLDPAHWQLFIYRADLDDAPLGYGLLRWRDERWWVTGAVDPAWQGRGIGRAIFEDLCQRAPTSEVWLEVWDWNTKAQNLYRSLGFVQTGTQGSILLMRLAKP